MTDQAPKAPKAAAARPRAADPSDSSRSPGPSGRAALRAAAARTAASRTAGLAPPTNTLAIVALILGFVVPLGGIICGHLALGQIKRTGESGHGLAMAGTVIGYVLTGLTVLFLHLLRPLLRRAVRQRRAEHRARVI